MICAAEDVGMADPQALVVATAAAQAVERIGMPEAQIILSEAVTYVATAPKSNTACEAVFAAMASVKKKKTSVPAHLQEIIKLRCRRICRMLIIKDPQNWGMVLVICMPMITRNIM